MSSLMSAISDDIRKYKRLASLFNEEVQYKRTYYGSLLEDCYGDHAKKLIKLEKEKNYD